MLKIIFVNLYAEPFPGAPCPSLVSAPRTDTVFYNAAQLESYPCFLILNCILYHSHCFTGFITCI